MKIVYKKFILVIWLTAIFSFSSAQNIEYGKILDINVEGNKTSDEYLIKKSSGLNVGDVASMESIQKAVKSLWELGLFSDIRIILDRKTYQGVYLTIKLKEYPRLDKLVIEGNKKLSEDKVKEELGFFRGQVLKTSQVSAAVERLKKKYAEKGFTLAQISTDMVESEGEGRVILHVKIKEGKKVQIRRIRFFGNEVFSDGKLKKRMKKTKENRWFGGGDFDKEKYREDKKKIIQFYQKYGYRDAEILKDSIYYDDQKKDMFIDIWVREGPCYYIGDVTWEGNEVFPDEAIASFLKLEKGDVFNQEKFQKVIREDLSGAYWNIGYIQADIRHYEKLHGRDTIDVHFVINENDPVTIRHIQIVGNHRTKDRVILREIRLRPGDTFSKELLERSFRDLMILNYFSTVNPIPIIVDEKNMDLRFEVEEKSTDTANLQIGWSELDRLIGSIGLGMNNLFGNGQQLNLNWNFGRFYRSLNLSFTEPWFLNTPTLIGGSIYHTKRDPFYIGYRQQTSGITFRVGRRLKWPDNYFRADWIYGFDNTSLSDFNEYYKKLNPNNIVNEHWPLMTSGITQIITRNSLDHPEFPTRGSRVSLTTEVAGGFLGGNVDFHKHIFKAEFFMPTLIPRVVLMARAQFGFMNVLKKSGRIPFLEYFFMGGSGLSRSIPLRGYPDPLVGGRFSSDGGKTMLQATLELRFPILAKPTAFGIIFAEAGNTWEDIHSTDPFDLRRSIGAGIRVYMPMVGLIGFDYAYGFDRIVDGKKKGEWQPHFIFGRGF